MIALKEVRFVDDRQALPLGRMASGVKTAEGPGPKDGTTVTYDETAGVVIVAARRGEQQETFEIPLARVQYWRRATAAPAKVAAK